MKDIIIIGAGAAGMSATVYASSRGLSVVLLEAAMCGGKMARSDYLNCLPWCSSVTGWEMAFNMLRRLEEEGVAVTYDRALQVSRSGNGFAVSGEKDHYFGRCVILATGKAERTKIPALVCGEDLLVSDINGDLRVLTDNSCRTSVPGVFAAGEVRGGGPVSVVTSLADGVVAVISAADYIMGQDS